jgi:phage terminase large subunit-like protein
MVVYEYNAGGDLIPTVIRGIDPDIPLKGVFASNAKIARAEPISLKYEKGFVKHVSNPNSGHSLSELETQMTTFEPLGKHKSPDRYDAMVWAITQLLFKGVTQKSVSFLNLKS